MDVQRNDSPLPRLRGIARLSGLLCAALLLPACASDPVDPQAAPGAAPPGKVNFSGRWTLNADASEDPEEQVKEAMKGAMGSTGGGRGMGGGMGGVGGGGRGGGMGGGQGRKASGGKMGGNRPVQLADLAGLLHASQTLELSHQEPLLLIVSEDGRRQRLYTDFRGATVYASGGLEQPVTTAGWEADTLVVETTTDSQRLVQRYRLDAERNRLIISSEIRIPRLPEPVVVKRVYDRVDDAVASVSPRTPTP